MSDLVRNPDDVFSHDVAQMKLTNSLELLCILYLFVKGARFFDFYIMFVTVTENFMKIGSKSIGTLW